MRIIRPQGKATFRNWHVATGTWRTLSDRSDGRRGRGGAAPHPVYRSGLRPICDRRRGTCRRL